MSDVSEFRIERDEASAPFFDAAARGTLLLRRCDSCGRTYPPQQRRCLDGSELSWTEASGEATLITWAVDHAAPASAALLDASGAASVIGVVELAEGPWMNTALPGVDAGALDAGMAMRVEFVALGGGESVPVFTPA